MHMLVNKADDINTHHTYAAKQISQVHFPYPYAGHSKIRAFYVCDRIRKSRSSDDGVA